MLHELKKISCTFYAASSHEKINCISLEEGFSGITMANCVLGGPAELSGVFPDVVVFRSIPSQFFSHLRNMKKKQKGYLYDL